jgi:hypothetical protein
MLLIKEITIENCLQFNGLPVNVMVVEHKQGDEQFRHSFYLIGIVVAESYKGEGWLFYVQFTNGSQSPAYGTERELIQKEGKYFAFYYIEIKK